MKVVDSMRRQIVMVVLLALAAIGAGIRYWADNPSIAREVGTLMLVLWLPAVGNLVAFAVRKLAPHWRPARGFVEASEFRPQIRAEIRSPDSISQELKPRGRNCTVVIGQLGFSARAGGPLTQALLSGPCVVELELLRPALALPRLPPGTEFQVLIGPSQVATGRVLSSTAL